MVSKATRCCPPSRSCIDWPLPLYGNVHHLHARQALEDFPARCGMLPFPAEGKLTFPGFAFRKAINAASDWICVDGCTTTKCGTAAAIATGAKSLITSYGRLRKRGRDRVYRNVAHHDRVAVGWRLRHLPRRDRSGCARPVVDHDRLAEKLRHARRKNARHYVGAAARREPHHHAHRPVRIILRSRAEGDRNRQEEELPHTMAWHDVVQPKPEQAEAPPPARRLRHAFPRLRPAAALSLRRGALLYAS